jgi:hypothetical protein
MSEVKKDIGTPTQAPKKGPESVKQEQPTPRPNQRGRGNFGGRGGGRGRGGFNNQQGANRHESSGPGGLRGNFLMQILNNIAL